MALVDITEDAKLLLRAIEDTRGKFGFNLPIEVILGRRNARISKQGFDTLPCHGLGRHKSEEHWKAVSRTLSQELLVDSRNGGGGKGFRGKGGQSLSVYSVSNLGKQLLDGTRSSRVMADLQAEASSMEMERAHRAARQASRKERAAAASPRPAAPAPEPVAPWSAPSSWGNYGSHAPMAAAPADSEWLSVRREPAMVPMAAPVAAPLLPPPASMADVSIFDAPLLESFAFPAQEAVAPADHSSPPPAAKRRKLPASLTSATPTPASASAPAPAPAPVLAPAAPAPAPAPATALVPAPVPVRPRAGEDGLRPEPHPGEIPAPSQLPKPLDAALMPFQRAGVAFAVRRQGRVLIGDDMGLGKTIQAIATCCAFRKDWPALVVVPNSVRLVWADELERWIPDLGPGGVNVVRSSQDLIELTKGVASFHIVTYGILTRNSPVRDFLRDSKSFGCLVVDESHMIKNRSAQRTKEVLHIARQCERVILLSGTPALARPLELYTQIEAVAPGSFVSFNAFTKRYCNPKWTPFGIDLTGASNLEELHATLRPIMVRRLKIDVLNELPSKRRQRVQLEIGKEAMNAFVAMKEELEGTDDQAPRAKQRVLMQMYKETGEAKIGAVSEYVEDLIHGGCKFLVFGHHMSMLDALEEVAVRSKVKYIRIDGKVPTAERHRQVAQFQADDSVRVAILGILAAGVGITLTAATTVVFAELHWTPGVLVQAEDRAHRIGQKSSVNIHYLIGSGTIDDILWPAVSKKVEIVSTMCDGKKDSLIAKLQAAGRATEEALQAAAETATGELMIEDGDESNMDDLIAVVDRMTPRRQPHRRTESPQSEKKKAKQGKAKDKANQEKPRPEKKESAKKESAYSIISMLQGKGPGVRAERWGCGTCGVRNGGEAETCSSCGAARGVAAPDAAPRRRPPTPAAASNAGPPAHDNEAIESASDAEGGQDEAAAAERQEFLQYSFYVARVTSRVHLLDASGRGLGCNFKLADWEAHRDVGQILPEALLSDPALGRCTDAFLREWTSLRTTEQRQLVDQTLHMPLWKILRQRKAENGPSTRRLRQKAVAGAEGVPAACAWCKGKCAQGSAFCSPACEEKSNVRSSMAVARNTIFAVEHGVCQVCGLDAHALYERVKAMTPPERHQELLRAGFKERKAMLENPQEGQFWQADHILPVAEGGGECDITNLRTLCTMCHQKETKRLQDRLRQAGWGKNSTDVRKGLAKAFASGRAAASSATAAAEQDVRATSLEVEQVEAEGEDVAEIDNDNEGMDEDEEAYPDQDFLLPVEIDAGEDEDDEVMEE